MDTLTTPTKRRRGGQPGNGNALRNGRYAEPKRLVIRFFRSRLDRICRLARSWELGAPHVARRDPEDQIETMNRTIEVMKAIANAPLAREGIAEAKKK